MIRILATAMCLSLIINLQAQMTGKETTVDGSKVRIYLVQKGETLYGISRKFDIAPSVLLKLNPQAESGLDIGQEFYIPFKTTISPEGEAVKVHIVKKGETLYSIARGYEVSEDDIIKLNKLESNNLNIGQQLSIPSKEKPGSVISENTTEHKVQPGETLYALSKKYGMTPEEIMEINNLSSPSLSVGQTLKVNKANTKNEVTDVEEEKDKANEAMRNENTEEDVESPIRIDMKEDEEQKSTEPMPTDEFVEVVEEGLAELIPDSDNTRKYLALHRTVKPGTIIRVRNEMNGREVWARVIGTLPENAENKNLLIKISKAAYDRLGALDKRFRVTITYIP